MNCDPIRDHRIWHMVRARLQTGEYQCSYGDYEGKVRFRTKFGHGITFSLCAFFGGDNRGTALTSMSNRYATVYSGFWKAVWVGGGDRIVEKDIPDDVAAHVTEVLRAYMQKERDKIRSSRKNEIVVSMDKALDY